MKSKVILVKIEILFKHKFTFFIVQIKTQFYFLFRKKISLLTIFMIELTFSHRNRVQLLKLTPNLQNLNKKRRNNNDKMYICTIAIIETRKQEEKNK